MTRLLRSASLISATLVLAGCGASTQVAHVWKAPGLAPLHFQKVVTVCVCNDAGTRRTVEDALAHRIKGATASYTILPDQEARDTAKAKAAIRQGGFDGAVVMRMVGTENETTYIPPDVYGGMYGYWGYGYGAVYEPGYLQTDQIVSYETNVYDVAAGKLVWSSQSKTYNPSSVNQMVGEIITSTADEMHRQGVLAGK